MKTSIVTICSVITALLWFSPQAMAIGISPALVQIDNIPAGGSVEKVINFSRGDASVEEKGEVVISGEAAPYIRAKNEYIVTLPQGQNITPFYFIVEPGSLAEGTYSAKINITPYIEEATESGISGAGSRLLAGAQGEITFSVTNNEIQNYIIDNIIIPESEENEPVGFSYNMRNEGNVDAKPYKIIIDIIDNKNQELSYSETIETGIDIVPAFTDETNTMLTTIILPISDYNTTVSFYNKEGEITASHTNTLHQVFPEGALAQDGEITTITSERDSYDPGDLIKISTNFKNTGTVGLRATLTMDIYLADKRIEALTSKEIFIPNGTTKQIDIDYKALESGKYTAKGTVSYGINKTEEVSYEFTVKGMNVILIIIIAAVLASILAIGFIVWKKKKGKGKKKSKAKAKKRKKK